jgi:hypothetical protein
MSSMRRTSCAGCGDRWKRSASVNQRGCLAYVIAKIVNHHPNSQIDDLLPWAYSATPTLKAVA